MLTSELLDDDLGIGYVSEPLHLQELVAALAVERPIAAVLPGLPIRVGAAARRPTDVRSRCC